ncbi:MAG: response regulator transcription factor [Coriobacteriia bacterium]|nr:response regulator transcription factor [Coriobacteriia bacterium]MCL2749630.1 response regulator transcription factor [Coriobacteriia bacterium]
MRLLIIEDEKSLAEAVREILVAHNYAVDLRFDGKSGLDLALSDTHDAIIIDIMLPGLNGFSVLEEIRAHGISTPVLLLTARTQTSDKVRGLDSGADDYLTKPFTMAELMARLRALSRRRDTLETNTVVTAGNLELDMSTLQMRTSKQLYSLTLKEAQLLELFMRHPNSTLSVQNIVDRIWGYESDATERHVQVYVSFLRKKLALVDTDVSIETVRGVGYRLVVQVTHGDGEGDSPQSRVTHGDGESDSLGTG